MKSFWCGVFDVLNMRIYIPDDAMYRLGVLTAIILYASICIIVLACGSELLVRIFFL